MSPSEATISSGCDIDRGAVRVPPFGNSGVDAAREVISTPAVRPSRPTPPLAPPEPGTRPWCYDARVRGALVAGWDANLEARHGAGALRAVRTHLGDGAAFVDSQLARQWVHAGVQIAIVDAITHVVHGGDPAPLRLELEEDVRARLGRARLGLVRLTPPSSWIARAAALHDGAYDVGRVSVRDASRRRATLEYRGPDPFADPTWQRLQAYGWSTLLSLTGHPPQSALRPAPSGFDLVLSW